MTDSNPTRPLWEVMHDAYLTPGLSGPRGHLGFAAEICAIAYWLAPLEPGTGPLAVIASMEIPEITAIRTCLLAEADRAEAAQSLAEPNFTDEEVELHSAPWSYLEPPTVDAPPHQPNAA